jgi:hypothetical protein
MISTRVKPPRRLLSLFNIVFFLFISCLFDCVRGIRRRVETL